MFSFQPERNWKFHESDIPNLEKKTYLVTGANSGLGFSTVYHLIKNHASVVMHCRSKKKCENAQIKLRKDFPDAELSNVIFDLSDFGAIKRGMLKFKKRNVQLDGLVLNAGLAYVPFAVKSGLETHFAVNHFGYFLVVKYLWDQLTDKSRQMTVTVVSSNAHWLPFLNPPALEISKEAINDESTYNPQIAYGKSKLANVLFSNELADKLRPYDTYVNSLNPGAVATNIMIPTSQTFNTILHFLANNIPFGFWKAHNAALTQVFTAVSPQIFDENIFGKYFHPQARETTPIQHFGIATWTEEQIWQKQRELWKFSEEYIVEYFDES